MKTRIAMLLMAAPLLAVLAFAHNGMEHVMGTVKTISDNSVTVQTAAQVPKMITVALLPSTKFSKSGADASPKDLKVGDRVMVDAKENSSNKLEAVTVTFGKQPQHNANK
ncbi:MAG TPA: DUF5666 domain-containing protein [Candidatus Acidoferrales bacterium]